MPRTLGAVEVTGGNTGSRSSRAEGVEQAITAAQGQGAQRVIVPDDYIPYDASSVPFDTSIQMLREGQMSDVVDVKAFGAAGDGPSGTDDLQAINEAASWADANSYEKIHHPPGTYTVSGDPTFPGSTAPVGRGASYDGSSTSIKTPIEGPPSPSPGDVLRSDGTEWEHIGEAPLVNQFRCERFGADPTASGATNSSAIQDAIVEARKSDTVGVVSLYKQGVYALDEVGANPYESGHRHCVDIGDGVSGVVIRLGPGVELKLADDQQTDANGPVDMIVGQDLDACAVVGAGAGVSRVFGNTAGQTNWTGGYAQTSNGNIIASHQTSGSGHSDLRIAGLQLDDHFSNPVMVEAIGDEVASERITLEDLYGFDCGEGFLVSGTDGVTMDRIRYEDPSDVAVGDAIEASACSDVDLTRFSVQTNGAGAAVDLFGSKGVRVSEFEVDGWNHGFTFQTHTGGRTVEDVTIQNGEIRNLRGDAFQEAEDGPVTVNNVQVFGGTSTLWMQFNGPPTMERMRFVGCDFYVDGSTDVRSIKVRDGSRVSFIGCSFATDEDTAFGSCIIIQRTTSNTPDLIVKACEFGSDLSTAAVTSDGGGNSFSPTGAITGCEFNGAPPLNATNSGDFSAMDLDPNVRIADADRPTAGIAGRMVFNTIDGNLNIDTGSSWILPDGTAA